jgi:transcriptional regulator GlxA family with amidase domain
MAVQLWSADRRPRGSQLQDRSRFLPAAPSTRHDLHSASGSVLTGAVDVAASDPVLPLIGAEFDPQAVANAAAETTIRAPHRTPIGTSLFAAPLRLGGNRSGSQARRDISSLGSGLDTNRCRQTVGLHRGAL